MDAVSFMRVRSDSTVIEELGTAYDEAYKYAEIAEGSRGDMEVLVQAILLLWCVWQSFSTQQKGKR